MSTKTIMVSSNSFYFDSSLDILVIEMKIK